MIAHLKGTVDHIGDGFAIIDVHGVGYRLFVSARTLGRLTVGRPATLLVETHVREDHFHLYGFTDSAEKEWFSLLTTVQGVGTKVALSILSVATPDDLLRGLAAQDKTLFTRASGVGPKLATRLLTELRGKAPAGGSFVASSDGGGPAASQDIPSGGVVEDAVSALVNLGYRRLEAFEAAGAALHDLKAAGAQTDPDPSALIRLALRRLGKDTVR